MNKLTLSILLVLTLLSCEDRVKFEKPQPMDKNDLNQIPRKLRGTYKSNSDDTFLTINENLIFEWIDFQTRTHIDSLDIQIDSTKMKEITPDSIQVIDGAFNLAFKLLAQDSMIVYFSYRDTIFDISDEHILRRFKGHYFLNYQRTEDNWIVKRLTLDRGNLSFSKVRAPEDLAVLKKITEVEEVKSDSGRVTSYKLNPTRRELKNLMKNSFSETKKYTKLN